MESLLINLYRRSRELFSACVLYTLLLSSGYAQCPYVKDWDRRYGGALAGYPNLTQTTTYTVTVTDPNNPACQEVKTFTVKVPTAQVTDCDEGLDNTSIIITVTDGTQPYQRYIDGIRQTPDWPTSNVPFVFSPVNSAILRIVTAEGCELIFNYTQGCNVQPQFRKEKSMNVVSTENQIELYPNPANERVNISYHFGTLESSAQVSICDVQGKEVFRQTLKGLKGETDISTVTWSPGVFICKIFDGNRQISVQKLVITR